MDSRFVYTVWPIRNGTIGYVESLGWMVVGGGVMQGYSISIHLDEITVCDWVDKRTYEDSS